MHCRSSSNLFGCVGLSGVEYCIFNKQYSKEDYEKQVAKIITHMITIGEWGEFFYPSLSPFGYNETVAQEYYPVVVESGKYKVESNKLIDLESLGYNRSSYEAPKPISDKVVQCKDLEQFESYLHQLTDSPSLLKEVATKESEDLLQYAIACEVTGKLFRIQPQELAFYRKHSIPLPRKHPDQRHLERLEMRK